MAQWIRHRPAEPGIVGSSPTGVMHTCDTVVSFSVSSQNQITSVDVSGIFSSVVCKSPMAQFQKNLKQVVSLYSPAWRVARIFGRFLHPGGSLPMCRNPETTQPHGPLAQWTRHRPSEPGNTGSSPAALSLSPPK